MNTITKGKGCVCLRFIIDAYKLFLNAFIYLFIHRFRFLPQGRAGNFYYFSVECEFLVMKLVLSHFLSLFLYHTQSLTRDVRCVATFAVNFSEEDRNFSSFLLTNFYFNKLKL